jgi:hypothetical protein
MSYISNINKTFTTFDTNKLKWLKLPQIIKLIQYLSNTIQSIEKSKTGKKLQHLSVKQSSIKRSSSTKHLSPEKRPLSVKQSSIKRSSSTKHLSPEKRPLSVKHSSIKRSNTTPLKSFSDERSIPIVIQNKSVDLDSKTNTQILSSFQEVKPFMTKKSKKILLIFSLLGGSTISVLFLVLLLKLCQAGLEQLLIMTFKKWIIQGKCSSSLLKAITLSIFKRYIFYTQLVKEYFENKNNTNVINPACRKLFENFLSSREIENNAIYSIENNTLVVTSDYQELP